MTMLYIGVRWVLLRTAPVLVYVIVAWRRGDGVGAMIVAAVIVGGWLLFFAPIKLVFDDDGVRRLRLVRLFDPSLVRWHEIDAVHTRPLLGFDGVRWKFVTPLRSTKDRLFKARGIAAMFSRSGYLGRTLTKEELAATFEDRRRTATSRDATRGMGEVTDAARV